MLAQNAFFARPSKENPNSYRLLSPIGSNLAAQTKTKTRHKVGHLFWLRGQDSNLRPRGYEPRELPLLHPARRLKGCLELDYGTKQR